MNVGGDLSLAILLIKEEMSNRMINFAAAAAAAAATTTTTTTFFAAQPSAVAQHTRGRSVTNAPV